jgi:hypothetical protein
MRYLFGFLWIFVFLLLPFIACGDWLEGPDSPCEGVNCNDGNPCTDDSCTHDCSSATCVHDPVENGTGCSLRGVSGVCINGVCDLCAGVVCEDDGNECIDDVCRAYTGTCGVPADNGTVCEYKGILPGFCASGFCAKSLCEDGTCDDGNECTDDVCDPLARRCSYIPLENYTGCDLDGLSGVCLDGLCGEDLCEGVACDDQNPCTDDTCDYADGTCDFFAVEDGANCDFDGFRSVCISGVCQPECESPEDCDDESDCTEDLCVDGTCQLVPVTDGAECDDGNECTADMCANGVCEGTPVEDGTACRDGGGACEAGTCMSGLLWPIDCVPGETCDSDVGYPDIDKDGQAFDCVSPVHTWRGGTGIGITWAQMDAGMDVLAAAPGQVIWVFDGKYDRCPNPDEPDCQPRPSPESPEGYTVCTEPGDYCGQGTCCCYWCFAGGNVVVIRHADVQGVFATRYDHLKKGSVVVTDGEFVGQGQKIAEVGSAGNSSGPHLYFEVWGTGFYELADPWAGPCGSNLSDPLWAFDPPWAQQEPRGQ